MNDPCLSDQDFAAGGSCSQAGGGDACRRAESALAHLESLLRRSLADSTYSGMAWHKFAARAVDRVAALRRAFASGNAVELAREAQTLKEVAACLSANELHALADELAHAAGRSDLQAAGPALERACREIDRCAGVAGESPAPPPTRQPNAAESQATW
jgi:HPt (histidine-containing phosphotransfer) domain-containing protein